MAGNDSDTTIPFPDTQDFAETQDFGPVVSPTMTEPAPPSAGAPREPPHVHYELNVDTAAAGTLPPHTGVTRSDTELTRPSQAMSPTTVRRRNTRANTFRTLSNFDDFEKRPGWRPGAEPGVDPYKTDGGHASSM